MRATKCGPLAQKGTDMSKITKIDGVDVRAIEKEVRKAYEANQEEWNAMCGVGKIFPSVFDLIAAKEAMLKDSATKAVGERRSALMSLRIKRWVQACKDGIVEDVSQDDIDDYIESKS